MRSLRRAPRAGRAGAGRHLPCRCAHRSRSPRAGRVGGAGGDGVPAGRLAAVRRGRRGTARRAPPISGGGWRRDDRRREQAAGRRTRAPGRAARPSVGGRVAGQRPGLGPRIDDPGGRTGRRHRSAAGRRAGRGRHRSRHSAGAGQPGRRGAAQLIPVPRNDPVAWPQRPALRRDDKARQGPGCPQRRAGRDAAAARRGNAATGAGRRAGPYRTRTA